LTGIYKIGGTCGLIRQYTKNLTNSCIIKKINKKLIFFITGAAWLSSVRILKRLV